MQKYRKYVGKYLWKNSTLWWKKKGKRKKNANFRNVSRFQPSSDFEFVDRISARPQASDLFERRERLKIRH